MSEKLEKAKEAFEQLFREVEYHEGIIEDLNGAVEYYRAELEFYKKFERKCSNCMALNTCDVVKILSNYDAETFVCTSWDRNSFKPLSEKEFEGQ